MKQRDAIIALIEERKRQDVKHPRTEWPDTVWTTVLMEEVGEVARAILDGNQENMIDELIHVATVAIRMVEIYG